MDHTPLPPDKIYISLTPPKVPTRHYPLRLLTASAFVVLACIILGCMSISFGGRSSVSLDDGLLEQEDKLELHNGATQTVFYPVPYGSPPNLVVDSTFHEVEIEEQAADHFRVRCSDPTGSVTWKAKGLRVTSPPPIVVAPIVPPPDSGKH
jgi:hypothetical protein